MSLYENLLAVPRWQLDELAEALQPHLMAMMVSPNGYPMFMAEEIQYVWEKQEGRR